MYGDDRPSQDDAAQLTGQERPDHGVRPIGDVLAELLNRYQRQYPEINGTVVEEPLAAS